MANQCFYVFNKIQQFPQPHIDTSKDLRKWCQRQWRTEHKEISSKTLYEE